MTTFAFIQSCGLLHWAAAIVGIVCLLLVRLIGVNEFSMRKWLNENLIGVIWSLFFLSLIVTLTHEYLPGFHLVEAFLTGYSGSYLIFRLTKDKKQPKKTYHLKHPHKS